MYRWTLFVLVLAALLGAAVLPGVVSGQAASAPAPKAAAVGGGLLGSPQFAPTPANPIGWRGDWTGNYPGATPPTVWNRRINGVTNGMVYQSAKPAGDAPAKDAQPLEYFQMKDWLIAGPFASDDADPAKGIEKDYLGGEAGVQPDAKAKAGDKTWQPWRILMDNQATHVHNGGIIGDLAVDFVSAFGTFTRTVPKDAWQGSQSKVEGPLDGQVAYAHSYLHAPAGGPAVLKMAVSAAASKVWLNGQPVNLDKNNREVKVELAKGWNRLLVKLASPATGAAVRDKAMSSNWRFAAYIMPPAPYSYQSSGIAWMTRVTGRSMSSPVVLGEHIYVGSGITDLMCINKADGKVLWGRSNTPWDALTADERKEFATIEPLAAELDRLNAELPAIINAQVSPAGMDSKQQDEMDKKLKAKEDAEMKLHRAMVKLDPKRFVSMPENEVSASNGTPVTDGKRVYWMCGGGMKGPGASVISCFEPDGKRVWSYHAPLGAPEHGVHTSLLLVDGKLVAGVNRVLLALDPANGKVLWQQKCNEFSSTSPLAVRVGEEWMIMVPRGLALHRASDGTRVAGANGDLFGDSTPVVGDGAIFVCDQFKTWGDNNVAFLALPVPMAVPNKGEWKPMFDLKWEDTYVQQRGISYYVASPLYHDGLVYTLDMSGGLAVIDVKERKGVYRRWLDGYCRYHRYLYGAVASPTLGGKFIYMTDDSGYTIVIAPGRQYQEIARNVIENIHLSTRGGNPCRVESFYSNPVFDGKFIFIKGEEYLYGIGGK